MGVGGKHIIYNAMMATINPNDEVIDEKGVKVFIDPAAVIYLLGTEMDYKKDNFSTSFTFTLKSSSVIGFLYSLK